MRKSPDWWTNAGRSASTPEGKAAQASLDELSKRLTGKAPVERVLTEALKDPDGATRTLAVRCLMAVDSLPSVLDALDDDKFTGNRVARITTAGTVTEFAAGICCPAQECLRAELDAVGRQHRAHEPAGAALVVTAEAQRRVQAGEPARLVEMQHDRARRIDQGHAGAIVRPEINPQSEPLGILGRDVGGRAVERAGLVRSAYGLRPAASSLVNHERLAPDVIRVRVGLRREQRVAIVRGDDLRDILAVVLECRA